MILDDDKYWGGNYWEMLHGSRFLISSAHGPDKFVVVSVSYGSIGSCLRMKDDGDIFYSVNELKELFKNAEYLGEFCDFMSFEMV